MYNQSLYGIRLKNVLEVYDTGKRHETSGAKYLGFRDVSLVPFDMKFIERGQLGPEEVSHSNLNQPRIQITLAFINGARVSLFTVNFFTDQMVK